MKIENIKFCRCLSAQDERGEIITTFTAQPYCVGMYVAIKLKNNTKQTAMSHKEFTKWVNESIKKMEENGLTVTTSYHKLIDYLPEEDIKEFILQN